MCMVVCAFHHFKLTDEHYLTGIPFYVVIEGLLIKLSFLSILSHSKQMSSAAALC